MLAPFMWVVRFARRLNVVLGRERFAGCFPDPLFKHPGERKLDIPEVNALPILIGAEFDRAVGKM